eukprot:COSAG02_NODE_3695_length_6374_cov_5.522869_4_plen_66_part_00
MIPDAVGKQQGASTYAIICMSTSLTVYAIAINQEGAAGVLGFVFDSMNRGRRFLPAQQFYAGPTG